MAVSTGQLGRRVGLLLFGLAIARLLWVFVALFVTSSARRYHLEAAWFIVAAVWGALVLTRVAGGERAAFGSPRPVFLAGSIAASLALYWPALTIGLLSDDYPLLAAPLLNATWEFVRPLPMLVWKGVFALAGAPGLHALNIALHGVNGWLVFLLFRRLAPGRDTQSAVVASAVFLSFPAAVEPVVWSAGIFDVALVTLALTALLELTRPGTVHGVVAVACLVAALLTKETAVCLPILAFVALPLEYARRPAVLIGLAIAVAYTGIRMVAADLPVANEISGYFLKEMISRPFATLGLPWRQSDIDLHPIVFGVVPQMALLLVLVGYVGARTGTLLALRAVVWVLVAVAPLGAYLFVDKDLEGSRYLYLPLVGWSILLAECCGACRSVPIWRHVVPLSIATLIVLGASGVRLHQQPWLRAASLRDAVVREAVRAATSAQCAQPQFAGVPEKIDGAYVFLNGFKEALAGVLPAPVGGEPPGARTCAFVWTGTTFEAVPAGTH